MEDEEAIETRTTHVDAALAEDEALHGHLHPVGVVVVTPSEAQDVAATPTCLVAEDLLVATTDDAGLPVDLCRWSQHDHALVPQAAVVVDADPAPTFGKDRDLLFDLLSAERTTIDQAAADVHPLRHPHPSADDTPPLGVGPQTSEGVRSQGHLHGRAVHHRAGDVPGTAEVEVPQPVVLEEEKTEADMD